MATHADIICFNDTFNPLYYIAYSSPFSFVSVSALALCFAATFASFMPRH